jgi:hypothetical protein
MTRATRYTVIAAGAGSLLLAGAAPALAARPADWTRCAPKVRVCANGPVNSGNLKDSQNVKVTGNPNDSVSPINVVGSPGSNITIQGSAVNSWNNHQQISGSHRR